jgi:NAD+ diphosphatase
MIHEIYPSQLNNTFIGNDVFDDHHFVLFFKGNTCLLKVCGEYVELPRKSDFSNIRDEPSNTFLFQLNGNSCFLIWDEPNDLPSNFIYKEISFFRTAAQQEIAWACLVGHQLFNWYSNNKYCGVCGAATLVKANERAVECPNCKMVAYPKISPAIIVAIVCGDKILLARNTIFPGGWYSLVAGYVDVGETLEETVKREVKEEVGIDIRAIRYYKSQPWPPSGSLMVGFIAEADDKQPIILEEKEIADARWFSRGNLPPHSSHISIGGELIEKFEKGEL